MKETNEINVNIATYGEVLNQVNRLGQYEFRLAISKLGEGACVAEVVAAVEAHREPPMKALGCNIGSAVMLSTEAWRKLAEQSEAAAKRELLKDSKALQSVDVLLEKANAAAEAARKAQDEFNRLYNELDRIPASIDALNLRLSQIATSREQLNNAEATVKDLYAAAIRGATVQAGSLEAWSGVVATREIRLGVLAEFEAESKGALAALVAREKELRKALGIK
jgi:hypothetical protein